MISRPTATISHCNDLKMKQMNLYNNITGSQLEITSGEMFICELVRRKFLTIDEARSCFLSGGILPDRVDPDEILDFDSSWDDMPEYMKFRLFINPYLNN